MWLGPPAMNRKITERAFAARCAALAANGFVAAHAACCSRSEANASPPKPKNASRINSRRVRVNRIWPSFHIKERIEIEHGQSELLGLNEERVIVFPSIEELQRFCFFALTGRPSRHEFIGVLD